MNKHEIKNCPRCNSPFECKVGSITLCQCNNVKLNEDEKNYLQENFYDCLCAGCMKIVKGEYQNKLFNKKLKSILGVFYRKNS